MIPCYISELIIPVGPTSRNVNSTLEVLIGVSMLFSTFEIQRLDWWGQACFRRLQHNELSLHGRSRDLLLTLCIAFAPVLFTRYKGSFSNSQQPKAGRLQGNAKAESWTAVNRGKASHNFQSDHFFVSIHLLCANVTILKRKRKGQLLNLLTIPKDLFILFYLYSTLIIIIIFEQLKVANISNNSSSSSFTHNNKLVR